MNTQQKPQPAPTTTTTTQAQAQPQAQANAQARTTTTPQPAPQQTGAPANTGAKPAQPAPAQTQAQAQAQAQTKPGQPAPAPAQAQTKPAQQAPAQGTADLRTRLRADFGDFFKTEVEFNAIKAYQGASQGLRFRLDRTKGQINSSFILISKKGGLLRPAFLTASYRVGSKDVVITNTLTGKPFLTLKENAKGHSWDLINEEAGKTAAGTVKVGQQGDVRSVTYSQGTTDLAYIHFRNPVQKVGMCSSKKPSNLANINVTGKFKSVTFEENPNGELCKDDLEVNAYYPNTPDQTEFVALVALLEVMAIELN